MTHFTRQPFIGITLCAIGGIIAADYWQISISLGLCLFALFILASFKYPKCIIGAAFMAFYILHTFQHFENPARQLAKNLSEETQPIRATGIVTSAPFTRLTSRGSTVGHFEMQLESIDSGFYTGTMIPTLVTVRTEGFVPEYGSEVSLVGEIRNFPPKRNPGPFDYAAYQQRRGVYSEIRVRSSRDAQVVKTNQGNPLLSLALTSRDWMQKTLCLGLEASPIESALITNMVLGLKSEMPDEVNEWFQHTGTIHVLVVSGLHIGMFTVIAWFLIRPFPLNRRVSLFLVILLLCFYALITGLGPACLRATLMTIIILGGRILDRRSKPLNNLAAAAFILLMWDTNQLFMAGFQFSFLVVGCIFLFTPIFTKHFQKLGNPDPFLPKLLWNTRQRASSALSAKSSEVLGLSLAAWIASIPLSFFHFHLITPLAPIINLAVVPLGFMILAEGVLALIAGVFSSSLAAIFNYANWGLCKVLLWIVQFSAQLPGGHFYAEHLFLEKPTLGEVVVFDLDDGGSTFLQTGDQTWLIDTGNVFHYQFIVRPYLQMRGVNRLDGLILTHGDSNHIGGALLALENMQPKKIILSPLKDRSTHRRNFIEACKTKYLPITYSQSGDKMPFTTEAHLEVLYPAPNLSRRVADDKALVLQFHSGPWKILFSSDSGFATEDWLLQHCTNLTSHLLVKGFHGNDFSGTPDFLTAVNPEAIITPQPLPAQNFKMIPQKNEGAVLMRLQNEKIALKTFLTDQTFTIFKR